MCEKNILFKVLAGSIMLCAVQRGCSSIGTVFKSFLAAEQSPYCPCLAPIAS